MDLEDKFDGTVRYCWTLYTGNLDPWWLWIIFNAVLLMHFLGVSKHLVAAHVHLHWFHSQFKQPTLWNIGGKLSFLACNSMYYLHFKGFISYTWYFSQMYWNYWYFSQMYWNYWLTRTAYVQFVYLLYSTKLVTHCICYRSNMAWIFYQPVLSFSWVARKSSAKKQHCQQRS